MKRALIHFLSAVLFLFIGITGPELYALPQQQDFPSIEPLFIPQELFIPTGMPTVFSADEVVQFSLLYSELTPDSAAYNKTIKKFEALREKITDPEIMSLAEEDRGRAILKLLYREVLKKYVSGQTRFDVAFETGNYNCVSSALVYMAAAKVAGLDVRGQKTPSHAFCSVYISGKKIDVETTNPYGFNPGNKEAIEKENEIKGYYVVPKNYYSNRREESDALFTGLIAGNLCSEYVEKDDYKKAVPLGAARFMAIMNEKSKSANDVRKEFDILAANFVNIIPDSASDFYEKLGWYFSFIDRWDMTVFLQNNADNAINNLLVLSYEENNYELANKGWQKYKSYVSVRRIADMEEMLVDILVKASTKGLAPDQQLAFIKNELDEKEGLAKRDLSSEAARKRLLLHYENSWLIILNGLMNEHKFLEGYKRTGQALSELPNSNKIKSMQKSFYNNCIADIHNNFASKANARKFEEARQILQEGLEIFPSDRTLNNDWSRLKKIAGE